MQAEADAALALVTLPTEEKQPLLLPALTHNRLCRARIYSITLITKLFISCHPTHGVAGRRWQKVSRGSLRGSTGLAAVKSCRAA